MEAIEKTSTSVVCRICTEEIIIKNIVGGFAVCGCGAVRLAKITDGYMYNNPLDPKGKNYKLRFI